MSDHVHSVSNSQQENAAFKLSHCQQVYLGYPGPGEPGSQFSFFMPLSAPHTVSLLHGRSAERIARRR